MTDEKVKRIIAETVAATVQQLQTAGLLKDGTKSPRQKTEELLKKYPEFCKVQDPQARRVVQEIDAFLEEMANDPYVDAIRLFYFGGLTSEATAENLCYSERTCRRNRLALVDKLAARLVAGDFIRELLA